MELATGLQTLLIAAVVAAIAPVVVALLPGPRIPQVVLLLVGGALVGPQVLALADRQAIDLLVNVGLGFLFLLAGYELDLHLFRGHTGRLAIAAWLVTLGLAVAVVGILAIAGFVRAFVPVALGLTTTALGTLMPILHENGMLGGRLGRHLLPAGTVGELLPIIAIALFLGASDKFVAVGSLVAVGTLAAVLSYAPRLVRSDRLHRIVREGEGSTTQITVRLTVVLLLLLLSVAQRFGLDVVLGAFLAGIVLRRWAGDILDLKTKLDAIGYGFFIPLFFVASGMGLDLAGIVQAPQRLAVFFVLLLLVRGVPVLFLYRGDLPAVERVEMMLLTATALPLLVALAEIGLRNGTMLEENAAAMVGAGALSVVVFPMLAVAIDRRRR
ncbi:MAG TPA: cation:proton antiporter, partial [Candidatus Limnocylindria bacterium]